MKNQVRKHIFFSFLVLACTCLAACSEENDSTSDAQQAVNDPEDSSITTPDSPDDMLFESYSEITGLEADPECTLSGKWISVRRTLNLALDGVVAQATHNWAYWEFDQTGTEVVVRKGLKCGLIVIDRSDSFFEARVLVSDALWEGLTQNINNTGRKGVYGKTESGQCFIGFEDHCKMRGATADYFCQENSAGELPPIEDTATQAQGGNPGWEDWDKDDKPGVTFGLAGTASGKIFVVQREVSQYFGPTELKADTFELRAVWEHWQLEIDKDPITIPSTDSYQAKEPEEHYIIFVRVDNLQNQDGTDLWDVSDDADDLAICEKMREVKDELIDDERLQADLDFQK